MATGVATHAASQLQSSVPPAVNTALSGLATPALPADSGGEQLSTVASPRQDAGLISTDQGNAATESQGSDLSSSNSLMENSELVVSTKLPVVNEQNIVTECDNNTSSEDDSLLMCSETIDSAACSIPEAPSAMDFFKNIAESTPEKNPAEDGTGEMPQTVVDCQEAVVDPVSLQDVEVSFADSDATNVQKDPTIKVETAGNDQSTANDSIENVTVQRLDVSSGISDLVEDCLPEHIYSESSHVDNEEENVYKLDVESDVQSSLQGVQEDDQNAIITSVEDGLPVNALQIIESFVESMEGSSLEKPEEAKLATTDDQQFDLSSGFLSTLPSSSQESSDLPDILAVERKGKEMREELAIDKNTNEGQSLSVSSRFEDECWDVSDTPIDVLSTSTSSSNSATECSVELTEREIKALEAFGSVRTSGRKRKPPTSLDVSPPRQVSGWVRGALRFVTFFKVAQSVNHIKCRL